MYLRSNDSKHGKSGTPYYVGKGRGKRAYNQHGRHTPTPTDLTKIVIASSGMKEEEAFQEETRLIKQYGRIDLGTGCLRNRTDGGEGQCGVHRPKPEAWKQWLREHPNSGQFRPGHASPCWWKGKKMTEEHRQKLSIAGRGRVFSSGSRAKISAALKGRVISEEWRRKLSASHKGQPWSEKRRNTALGLRTKITHCPQGHEYTSENTQMKHARRPNGPARVCRECARAYKVRIRARNNVLNGGGIKFLG